MKNIQKKVLEFLENEESTEKNYQNLINYFQKQKLKDNSNQIKELLYIILKISNNHHRTVHFFDKIKQILQFFRKEIDFYFTNFDIFNIFKSNKRILLFLLKEKFIQPDKAIAQIITKEKYFKKFYPHYFYPEFSSFFDENTKKKIESSNDILIYDERNSELFEKNREIGENDNFICSLIRTDSISNFISHVTHKNIPLTSTIEQSIFETNSYLIKDEISMIEYSAFFGSTQIFKYLTSKQVKPTPSIWLYAIHSQNPEIIHILEENKSKAKEKIYKQYLIECIKCHHIEIMKYISNKLLSKSIRNDFDVFIHSLKSYNYSSFPKKIGDQFINFYNFCKYDYFSIVEFLLKQQKMNLNQVIILYIIFLE